MDTAALLQRPGVRPALVVAAVVVALYLVALLTLVSLRAATGDAVLAGTSVDGEDVSGQDRAELTATVQARADELLSRPVEVRAGDEQLAADREEVGVEADAEWAIDAAWDRGRRGFYRALEEQLGARFGAEADVPVPFHLDDVTLERWARDAADALSQEPEPASLTFVVDGGDPEVEVEDAVEGRRVDPDDMAAEVADRYDEPGPISVEVPAEPVDPPTSDADRDAAIDAARRAVADDLVLENPSTGANLELTPADLAEVLVVVFDEDAAEGERLAVTSDADRFRDHLGEEGAEALDGAAEDAELVLADDEATVVGGTPGLEVDLDAVASLVVELADREDERDGELPGDVVEPDVTVEGAEEALETSGFSFAEVTLDNPSNGDDLVLGPTDLDAILELSFEVDDDQVALEVDSDGERLTEHLGDERLAGLQPDAVDASVTLAGGSVEVSDGTTGFEIDADASAELVTELVTREERTDELPGEATEPELTRELAETVQQEISSFSTTLGPGEPRNTNIRRAVEIIDGDLILPGERYSLNEGIGRRTEERGFVENGFIREGEVVSVTGGGVSQVGTTFMNTAWFAGIELVDFRPHSLYFTRYPMGREATISFNTIDVVVENDSPYVILIATSSSETEVEIAFWSTPWAEVDTRTGEPYNEVEGELRDGFDIDFGRTITYPDGSTSEESYSHRYQPEDEPADEDADGGADD